MAEQKSAAEVAKEMAAKTAQQGQTQQGQTASGKAQTGQGSAKDSSSAENAGTSKDVTAGNQLSAGDKAQVRGGKKIALIFNNETTVKLLCPPDCDVHKAYQEFEKAHHFVSDKKGAFPTSFAGELVNRHGCEQLDKDEKIDQEVRFRV